MTEQCGNIMHVTTNHFDPYGYFSNTNNGASSTFWIGEQVIGKCRCQNPQPVTLTEQYYGALYKSWAQVAGNAYYQSTETSGTPDTPLSAAQVHAYAHLYAWGHKAIGWPLNTVEVPNQHGFGWHGMGGSAWGGHIYCPGTLRRNQRAAILTQAKQILGGGQPQPHPHPPAPTPDLAPRYMGVLAPGSRGLPVHEWQFQMISRGWDIKPDGIFGPATEQLVRTFEQNIVRHGWAFVGASGRRYTTGVDGVIGMCVWHAAWDAPDLS